MSDLRLSSAPKGQPRRGQCRELAAVLTGVTSVLELDAKVLLAVSTWAKHVHERLLPSSFPAYAEIPALNNSEFELIAGDSEYFNEVFPHCVNFVDIGSVSDFADVRIKLNDARVSALQRDAVRRAAYVPPAAVEGAVPPASARAARYAARLARENPAVGGGLLDLPFSPRPRPRLCAVLKPQLTAPRTRLPLQPTSGRCRSFIRVCFDSSRQARTTAATWPASSACRGW